MDPEEAKYVCDLTMIMRSRLLCGMYSRRAVPTRWRGLAKAYCFILAVPVILYIYFTYETWVGIHIDILYWVPLFCQYFVGKTVSLWTGDEYIYTFFTQKKATDVTLDSSTVFNRLKDQIKTAYIIALVLITARTVLSVSTNYEYGLIFLITHYVPSTILEVFVAHTRIEKLLIMGLFNSRILVMRRRLERYGFRTIGGAPPQPYCQIYDDIWQGIDAMDIPLKLMLFFDVIFSCSGLIGIFVYNIYGIPWEAYSGIQLVVAGLGCILLAIYRLALSFGHVAILESAAAHCDAMAVFTATQLIKTPTGAERARMYALLGALERRGARYRVLRALPLDAQLVLQALGFCSAQAVVLINMMKEG